MAKAIWKFELHNIGEPFMIEMPKDAEILTVQAQYGIGCIWAICDTEAKKEERDFLVTGTGHEENFKGKQYIGTYQQSSGALVWHLFEIIKAF